MECCPVRVWRSRPGSVDRNRGVRIPGGTHRPGEVMLMSPEGTDPGTPQEEELRPPGLEDQRPP